MISQLLATIMMALGVASGTKTTSNTFYDERKSPQIKRAIENININQSFVKTSQVNTSTDTYNYTLAKYSIRDNTYQYTDGYLQIINTAYVEDRYYSGTGNYEEKQTLYVLLKINNFYNDAINITISTETPINVNKTVYYGKYWGTTTNNIDQYFNMTLTNTLPSQLVEMRNNFTWKNQTTGNEVNNNSLYEMSYTTEQFVMEPKEQVNILFQFYTLTYQNTAQVGLLEPSNININGSIAYPDTPPYEVVDIPGIMFTVLSMPFTFISQAFDLTIFPNTPYQINFTNLFMTLIAIFILLWIIKKVFK